MVTDWEKDYRRKSGLRKLASGGLWQMCHQAHVITFIGAGGKTTSVKKVTEEIHGFGYPVVASTTTKVFPDESFSRWQDSAAPPGSTVKYPCFWYAGFDEGEGKWLGPSLQVIDQAVAADQRATGVRGGGKRFWVVEGDGARGKKLKFWQTHEPQIPLSTECAVLVVNGGLWGKPLQAEDVHRPEVFPELIGEIWNAGAVWAYLLLSSAFERKYSQMAWVLFFNGLEFRSLKGKKINKEADKKDDAEHDGDKNGNWEKNVDIDIDVNGDREKTEDNKNKDNKNKDAEKDCDTEKDCDGEKNDDARGMTFAWLEELWRDRPSLTELASGPVHLRLAGGNAKEGEALWFDLW